MSKKLMKLKRGSLIAALFFGLLSGCAVFEVEAPTPFKTGREVPPPPGCIEYRTIGGDC